MGSDMGLISAAAARGALETELEGLDDAEEFGEADLSSVDAAREGEPALDDEEACGVREAVVKIK
jgi:hypothetical protein